MTGPRSDLSSVDTQLKRLLPLLPPLAMGISRTRGDIPDELRPAGRLGSRHVAALISLTVLGPATVGELAERLNITLNHASLVVRELNGVGLVARREDEADRRRVIVSVAADREREVRATAARASRPIAEFLATLSPEEADRFISQLSQLIDHLSAVEADPDAEAPRGGRSARSPASDP